MGGGGRGQECVRRRQQGEAFVYANQLNRRGAGEIQCLSAPKP
jgi:hypothetical protein